MGALEEGRFDPEVSNITVGEGGAGPAMGTIENAVRVLLMGLGEDSEREGLRKTPIRVAKAFREGTRARPLNSVSLARLLQDAGMTDLTHISWGLVNDTYKMDLILIHPPYMIALACIYIASVLKDKETTAWFEELRVDMNVVKNIAIEILDFYDFYRVEAFKGMAESLKGISDEKINAALQKLTPKP